MDFDFNDLKKIPNQPAARLLAMTNTKLETVLSSPANAPVQTVLEELSAEQALFDMLKLLSVALPPREAVWWACLAARDLVGHEAKKVPPALDAAEKWVFKPSDENRNAAIIALDSADIDDETVYCAMAVTYSDGKMGTGELSKVEAPPNAISAAVICMNMKSLGETIDTMEGHMEMLIGRALDIARGGNGKVEKVAAAHPDAVAEKGEV